jgi:hypothetical protein
MLTTVVSTRGEPDEPIGEPSKTDSLDLDIDLRLGLDVWTWLWSEGEASDRTVVACLLRFAYGRGYYDALIEPQRGKLCLDHGLYVPQRSPSRQ